MRLKRTWKLRQRKLARPFFIRQVTGESMLPALQPGAIVAATGYYSDLRPGDVVIFIHDGFEKIKRVVAIYGDKIEVGGDNKAVSTDSRAFGPILRETVIGKVLFSVTR